PPGHPPPPRSFPTRRSSDLPPPLDDRARAGGLAVRRALALAGALERHRPGRADGAVARVRQDRPDRLLDRQLERLSGQPRQAPADRKSTSLNSSHLVISYAV